MARASRTTVYVDMYQLPVPGTYIPGTFVPVTIYVEKTRFLGVGVLETSACPINTLSTNSVTKLVLNAVGMIPDVGTVWGPSTSTAVRVMV